MAPLVKKSYRFPDRSKSLDDRMRKTDRRTQCFLNTVDAVKLTGFKIFFLEYN